jgi:WD40 repeat protein
MKKLSFLLLTFFSFIFAQTLTPYKKITFNGYISKIAYNDKYLITGLENGEIVIKEFKTLKNLASIKLPKIHDFMGDLISMPIYSLDISPDNQKLMILAEGEDAKRELFIYNLQTGKLNHIFTTKETLMKGNFITDNKIFFALLSDEALMYDLKSKKNLYRTQIGNYVFSTYALSKDKKIAIFGDESGALKVVDINTGKKIKELAGYNKDKTLSCDIQKNLAINGSSDMRVAIYDIQSGYEKLGIKVKFLPYGASLSPDTSIFAVQYDEQNDIAVYSVYKKLLYILKGHTMALNGIKFLDEKTIISFSPAEIIIWKLY